MLAPLLYNLVIINNLYIIVHFGKIVFQGPKNFINRLIRFLGKRFLFYLKRFRFINKLNILLIKIKHLVETIHLIKKSRQFTSEK